MPLYQYKCDCGAEFEAFNSIENRKIMPCRYCDGVAQHVLLAQVDVFKPYWEEHLYQVPVFVESRRHLKELCKKHGKYASDL